MKASPIPSLRLRVVAMQVERGGYARGGRGRGHSGSGSSSTTDVAAVTKQGFSENRSGQLNNRFTQYPTVCYASDVHAIGGVNVVRGSTGGQNEDGMFRM